MGKARLWPAWILAVAVAGGEARAEEELPDRCLAAFEEAQLARQGERLLAAESALGECAAESCPDVVRRKCAEWLPEVTAAIPELVAVARERDGAASLATRLFVDDAPVVAGKRVRIEPGRHRVRAEHPDGRSAEREVVLGAGETRDVELVLPRPLPPPPAPIARPAPEPVEEERVELWPLVAVSFGLSGAATVVGAVTGGLALAAGDELDERCRTPGPDACTQREIDDAYVLAHVATGSFALAGAAALTGAVALGLTLAADGEVVAAFGPGSLTLVARF
jgi:hypothetical protein